MSSKLVITGPMDATSPRDIGENVFFDNLPHDYQVYLLYYPGANSNEELSQSLRNLGDITGGNLFVNMGKLNDPNFRKIAKLFNIKNYPVIIITAIDKLASPTQGFQTAYVKIESKTLLTDTDLTIECVQKVFNLFMEGKIAEAINQAAESKAEAIISRVKAVIISVVNFLKEADITISLTEGKFELKHG